MDLWPGSCSNAALFVFRSLRSLGLRSSAGASFRDSPVIILMLILVPALALGEEARDRGFHFELGEEYRSYAKPRRSQAGLKAPASSSFLRRTALFLPNRLLDIADIFKLDLGVGGCYGGMVRLTPFAQGVYRRMAPGSLRIGARGRALPVFIEERSVAGWGRGVKEERTVTPGEVGLGVDLYAVGVYAGVAVDEIGDFLLGWVGVDFREDDLR